MNKKLRMNLALSFTIGAALALGSVNAAAQDAAAGEAMWADGCAQCHGRAGRGMASFPSVAGQDEDYIASRLMQYRAGEPVGPNSALMYPVAAELSDDDIAVLATYISTNFQ